ncbi:DUF1801 domain-containing protein [Micromonospora sp. WMMC415]|nr:DUF1801 domain-containing protein [Micromonospora sp. WMMC415]
MSYRRGSIAVVATSKQPVTVPTDASVDEFLAAVPDERRRADALRLCGILRDITGEPPVMWGPSIVGFGSYRYTYGSGRTGDWPLVGFSPRRQQLVVYLVGGYEERYPALLTRLGPHKTGKGCLYLKRLDNVDEGALRELVERTVRVHKGVDRASHDRKGD